jgi:hypothetical protein
MADPQPARPYTLEDLAASPKFLAACAGLAIVADQFGKALAEAAERAGRQFNESMERYNGSRR